MKTSNTIRLFLQKTVKKILPLPSPSQSPILLDYEVVGNKEQTDLIR